jgi:hypothetical protein
MRSARRDPAPRCASNNLERTERAFGWITRNDIIIDCPYMSPDIIEGKEVLDMPVTGTQKYCTVELKGRESTEA